MRASFATWVALLAGSVLGRPSNGSRRAPFLEEVDGETWVIGNELWNMTQGRQYGVKLYYKDHDCVGDAVGHYVSYSESALVRTAMERVEARGVCATDFEAFSSL